MINFTDQAPLPAPGQSYGLTPNRATVNLTMPFPHEAVRGESRKNQQMPIQARLIRRLRYQMQNLFYGGRYLGSFGSHGSVAMSLNPENVHRPSFERFKRCSPTFNRDHAMSQNQSAQNPQTTTVSQFNPKNSVLLNLANILSTIQDPIVKADLARTTLLLLVDISEQFAMRANTSHEVTSSILTDCVAILDYIESDNAQVLPELGCIVAHVKDATEVLQILKA